MEQRFYDAVEASPVIAAVKDMEGLEKCCAIEEVKVVFILFGDVCSIADIVKRIREQGKIAMVHMDMMSGLSAKEVAVDYIKNHTHADGIISTKPTQIRRAKELGMYTILRFFVIDSMALKNVLAMEQQHGTARPDFIEILPGAMPKVVECICNNIKTPVIAGGLIQDKEDVLGALGAGAISVSTTNEDVWFM